MTTLAYKDGVLAADTQVNDGGARVAITEKIGRTDDGRLWGFTGSLQFQAACVAWAQHPDNPNPPPSWDDDSLFIVIEPDGRAREWCGKGWVEHLQAPFFAWGSGMRFAIGAMAAGADARAAVAIAARYDNNSGPPVRTLRLDGADTDHG